MSNNQDQHIILDKEIRRDLDAILQRLKKASDRPKQNPQTDSLQSWGGRSSRERSLAITKIQEGMMWLGMDLKAIDEENPGSVENPYPNSKDPSNTRIDKTADGLKF